MKSLQKKIISACLLVSIAGCSRAPSAPDNQLPASWVVQGPDAKDDAGVELTPEQELRLGQSVSTMFEAQSAALEQATAPAEPISSSLAPVAASDRPSDYAPWSMAYFITDLSVSVSGWLGHLVYKGNPSVSAYWRKQHAKAEPVQNHADIAAASEPAADVTVTRASSDADVAAQLEPTIRGAVASGEVQDESSMRRNVLGAALDFRNLASVLEQSSTANEWWASRLRLDLSVDASGKVTPVVTAGVDVRLRFEWHRIMKPGTVKPARPVAPPTRIARGLVELADSVSEDLQELSGSASGFEAASYRVGVGISKKGTVGIAKVTPSLIGHLYFSRDVQKPVVNPPPRPETASIPMLVDTRDVKAVQVMHAISIDGGQQARDRVDEEDFVVKIPRGDFRKGLKKALKIGSFFTRFGGSAGSAGWKIYELRAGVDVSLNAKTGLTTLNALGAAEIVFYNRAF